MLFIAMHSYGNDINVSAISFNDATNQLSFTRTWENSWTYWAGEPDLYDAAPCLSGFITLVAGIDEFF